MRARRRLTGHDEYGLVRGREQEGRTTAMLGTSAVADQRKTEETTGGGEELEARADDVTGAGIRYEMTDERGQDGKLESEEATATNDKETDGEVGSGNKEGDKI